MNFFSRQIVPFILLILLLLGSLLTWHLAFNRYPIQHYQLPPFIEQTTSCSIKGSNNPEHLVIFTDTQHAAQLLLNHLCVNSVVAKQFGGVTAYWNINDYQANHFIGKGIADLVLVTDDTLNAFQVGKTYKYRELASYPDYDAYLISTKEKPSTEKHYLLGKRIGLLDYPSSRSGHIIPMQLLREQGLTSEQVSITYTSSHRALRELLADGEVDLIASYWQNADEALFSKNYITLLQANVSGSRWFLKMKTANTDLFCAIQQELTDIAQKADDNYLQRLQIKQGCSDA